MSGKGAGRSGVTSWSAAGALGCSARWPAGGHLFTITTGGGVPSRFRGTPAGGGLPDDPSGPLMRMTAWKWIRLRRCPGGAQVLSSSSVKQAPHVCTFGAFGDGRSLVGGSLAVMACKIEWHLRVAYEGASETGLALDVPERPNWSGWQVVQE